MSLIPATTTCFSISKTIPATLDTASYDALADWVVYNNFRSVDDLVETRQSTKIPNMCTGKTDTVSGSIEIDDMTYVLGYDPKDQAQVDTSAQFYLNSKISIREVDSAGNIYYFDATITKLSRGRVDGDEVKRSVTVAINNLVTKII